MKPCSTGYKVSTNTWRFRGTKSGSAKVSSLVELGMHLFAIREETRAPQWAPTYIQRIDDRLFSLYG